MLTKFKKSKLQR